MGRDPGPSGRRGILAAPLGEAPALPGLSEPVWPRDLCSHCPRLRSHLDCGHPTALTVCTIPFVPASAVPSPVTFTTQVTRAWHGGAKVPGGWPPGRSRGPQLPGTCRITNILPRVSPTLAGCCLVPLVWMETWRPLPQPPPGRRVQR